jgi:hypothetical protein
MFPCWNPTVIVRRTPRLNHGPELTALERNIVCPSGTGLAGSAPVQLFAAAGIARLMARILRETAQIRPTRGPH